MLSVVHFLPVAVSINYVREGLILWAYLFLRTWTTVAAPLSQMNMKGQLHPLRTQFQANQAIINKLSNSSLKKTFFQELKKKNLRK